MPNVHAPDRYRLAYLSSSSELLEKPSCFQKSQYPAATIGLEIEPPFSRSRRKLKIELAEIGHFLAPSNGFPAGNRKLTHFRCPKSSISGPIKHGVRGKNGSSYTRRHSTFQTVPRLFQGIIYPTMVNPVCDLLKQTGQFFFSSSIYVYICIRHIRIDSSFPLYCPRSCLTRVCFDLAGEEGGGIFLLSGTIPPPPV